MLLLALASVTPTVAAAIPGGVHASGIHPAVESYSGAAFGALPAATPTEFESQSKVWFNDDAWWALLLSADGSLGVFELVADHSWRPASEPLTAGVVAVGDVLPGEQGVDAIVSTVAGLAFARLDYVAATRRYRPRTSDTATVTARSGSSATLTRDSTGRMWVALPTSSEVLVTSSIDNGASWSTPAAPRGPVSDLVGRESAAIVAFDESIGILWSDQARGQFTFAIHQDGAPDDEWTVEVAFAGRGVADDHISLKVVAGEGGDRLVAGVRTSWDALGGSASPLMVVLARDLAGSWSSHVAATVADDLDRPLVVVDSDNEELYFVAQAPAGGGSLYYKRAPLDDLSFGPGRGTLLAQADSSIGDATSTKEPVTARSGLVVLAASADPNRYHHAELALPASGPAEVASGFGPPPAPGDVVGTANGPSSVALYWSPSVNSDQWAPATDGTAAREYRVLRDGVQVGTTSLLSFVDRPAGRAATHDYAVVAVDGSGAVSAPSATVAVTVAGDDEASGVVAWAIAGLGVAGLAGGVVLVRSRRGNV